MRLASGLLPLWTQSTRAPLMFALPCLPYRAERASKLQRAIAALRNRLLSTAWRSWCDHCARKQQVRAALDHAVRYWMSASLRAGMAAFRHNAERGRRARAVLLRWRQAALAKAFQVWPLADEMR